MKNVIFILFIHLDCDDCNINCIGECPVHGPYNIVKDVEVYKICIQKKNYNISNLVVKLMHEKCTKHIVYRRMCGSYEM